MHEKSDVNDNECNIKKHQHSKRYLEMREIEREREREERWERREEEMKINVDKVLLSAAFTIWL